MADSEQTKPFGFIDPPGPFAPIEEWRSFLEEMRKLPQESPQVSESVREAEAMIARLEDEDDFSDLEEE